MRSEAELFAIIRRCVRDMNKGTHATFIFTHGLDDDRDNDIPARDDHDRPQAWGQITHISRNGEEKGAFEALVQQDDHGLVVTVYAYLDEALPIPGDPASYLLLDEATILQTKPILVVEDMQLFIEGVKATVPLNVFTPHNLFRAMRNMAGALLDLEQSFGDGGQ